MASLKVTVHGGEAFRKMLKGKNVTVLKRVDMEVMRQAIFLSDEVKSSISGNRAEPKSYLTGHFLRSVIPRRTKQYTAVVTSAVEYGPTLEYGTSTRKPRRHFQNSLLRNKKKIVARIQSAVNDAVNKK